MDLFHSPTFPRHVEELMEQHHVPGLAIAIVQDENISSAGYGHASLDPPQPCTPDTLFDIASASKSLTAASVGLLVNDERYHDVHYDATVSSLLPGDFVMPGDGYTEGVTVEDILSHRTGMAPHDSSYMSSRAAQPDDARSITRNLRNLAVAAPIRSRFMYCNMMFTVATYLVEKVSGLTFSDFLQEHLLRPLHMHSTSLQPALARAMGLGARIATGYFWDQDGERYHGFQSPDCPEAQGAGSIVTSVNDYIKWVKAVMNHEAPITDEVYHGLVELRTIQSPDAGGLRPFTSPTACGAGWEIFFYRGYMVVNHGGSISGFRTCHFFLPDVKFGGVIFGNSAGGDTVATILMRELIDEALKVPEAERVDWNKIESEDSDEEESEEELRRELCPRITESEPQTIPLSAYTGEYWNPGYHSLIVKVNNGQLFIDATDRSMGFTLVFDHVGEQTKYIAHLSDFLEGGDEPLKAEFSLEDGKAVKLGLHLETELKELIWFDRVYGDRT